MFNKSLEEIPDTISKLKNLEILDLRNCNLKNLPDGLKNLKSLERLALTGNILLKKLPKSLEKLPSLKILDLGLTAIDKDSESKKVMENLRKKGVSVNN